MKIGRLFPDLLATLGRAASPEVGFARTLRRLVDDSGAVAGGLLFMPLGGRPIQVIVGSRPGSALEAWIGERLAEPARGVSFRTLREPPPGWRRRAAAGLLRASLGEPSAPAGRFVLLGPGGRDGLNAARIPPGFPREFGLAMAQAWQLHQRTRRLEMINEVAALAGSALELPRLYQAVARVVARLIRFAALGVGLLDRERGELRLFDVVVSPDDHAGEFRDARLPSAGSIAQWVAEQRVPIRIDDLSDPRLPSASRERFRRRGFQSAVLAPLITQGEVIGSLFVGHSAPKAFSAEDEAILSEVALPLASAIEHARLHDEAVRRAEALGALNETSRLISARLHLPAVLATISRSVNSLIGSAGCGIGLLDAEGKAVEHVAAHGSRTAEWRTLSTPVGAGIIGRAAATGTPFRVDDMQGDPRTSDAGIDEQEGIRAMLAVPLRVGAAVIGVISAYSHVPGYFSTREETLLEAFAEQAGIAIQNARLFEESQRRAREMEALLAAGRAVSQSLDLGETIRVILHQAREVLGVQSGSIFTLDEATGELSSVASLDEGPARVGQIRVRVGQGITGLAVAEGRPLQSEDLWNDPRAFPQPAVAGGLRSMLAVPLVAGGRTMGALTALRADVHHFEPHEVALATAFADQAALAFEHARLFSSVRTYSERLEAMVVERTRELDEQKRFVEVVLETLPLGLYVLDRELTVVSANREGATALTGAPSTHAAFLDLVPADSAGAVRGFLQGVLVGGEVHQTEEEMVVAAETRMFRLTAAPLRGPQDRVTHAILLIEDITLQKRLERQMLLTERLTTAGRLVTGVAHEINNPLATIAGCAEALRERARDPRLTGLDAFRDFPRYLALIEEEAYRCKEFTGSLLRFVRDPGSRRGATDVNALVERTLELLRHQPRFASSELVTQLDPGLPPVIANEGQLRQVFLGIAANALEAMEGRGRLTVCTRVRGGEAEIEFTDAGPGIPEAILSRLFDPFFTTKPPGQGTGLGLAIAQGIVTDHAGRIDVHSRPGAGASFRVVLPITSSVTSGEPSR
ncbi:MAG TPA: GAF domain-containing protein [Candidatus Nitrosocosmicus sp.]|nr:GAF domain-containing protein [Candidatus Nitrosocosmicus sp.]